MVLKDVESIENDITEAFADLGTLDFEKNIQWFKRKHSAYDVVYDEDILKKYYNPTYLYGLMSGLANKDELTKEGLNYDRASKCYIVGKSYRDAGIVPKEWDRLIHKGIKYDIVSIKPYSYGDISFLYKVYLIESAVASQTEEVREEQDPYFEVDKSQEATETDTTGVNAGIFEDTVANILGDVEGDFDIMLDENDKVKLTVDGVTDTIQLAEAIHSAVEVVTDMQTKIDATFGSDKLLVYVNGDFVGIKTVAVGVSAVFSIISVTNSVYDTLGWSIGQYSGKHQLSLDYVNDEYDEYGDPL